MIVRKPFRKPCLIAALLSALAAILLAPSPAAAVRPLTTGVAGISTPWGFDHVAQTGARLVKTRVSWQSVAPHRPHVGWNPNDPAYNWAATDQLVKNAAGRGLRVLLTVYGAPEWAEGPGSQQALREGTWKPNPTAFGNFAQALATRYSGKFPDTSSPGLPRIFLPRVRYFEVWPEANLSQLLEPQWENGKPESPAIYRGLANAFTAGVKKVHADNQVLGPGLAPYGEPEHAVHPDNGPRMPPITFLRSLFCLKDNRKLTPTRRCPGPTRLDIVSHHPINSSGSPTQHAISPNNASSADLDRVTRVMRAAVRAGTLLPKRPHPLWATETWWESKPPSPRGQSPQVQARWIEEALHIFWRDGASVVIQQPLRDGSVLASGFGGGLFFNDGKAKPALRAFQFPFVARRTSKSRVTAWGKTPVAGTLKIQAPAGKHRHKRGQRKGWRTVAHFNVKAGQVFQRPLRLGGKTQLRATVGKTESLVWKVH